MSVSTIALSSISRLLRSGCGWLATGTAATRLSLNDWATARACGLPSLAKYTSFLASIWIVLPTLWNTMTSLSPIRPPKMNFSPSPRLRFHEKKKGLSIWSGAISSQTLSSSGRC
jgi:hypothetical protein